MIFKHFFTRSSVLQFHVYAPVSHHMLDISMHTYVLDLFFTRTFWTLFHTCILDMFSHPYFWPPCPIPPPSRGDLGLICSVEAFSVHLQTVELHCGSIPKTYKHIQSQYRQIIHRPKGPWHIIHQLGRPLAVGGVMWVVPHFIAQWCIAQFPAHWVHSTVWPSNLSRKSFLFGKRARKNSCNCSDSPASLTFEWCE